MSDTDVKICPYCKEAIRAKAVKCRFCGEWLSDSEVGSSSVPSEKTSATNNGITTPPLLRVQPAQTETKQPAPKTHISTPSEAPINSAAFALRGIKWLNCLLLVIWIIGYIVILSDDYHNRKDNAYTLGIILSGLLVLSAFAFGLHAATNPDRPLRRKRAKWSNLAVAILATFMALGFVSSNTSYAVILVVILGFPALINLTAFWSQQSTVQPLSQASPPCSDHSDAGSDTQIALSESTVYNSDEELTSAVSPTHIPKDGQMPPQDAVDAVPATEQANYFIRHWRGDLPLGITYWVNGMLGTLLILFSAKILVALQEDVGIILIAASSLVFYALTLLVSIWQAVGVWRSAGKHTSRGGGSGWAAVARIAVGFGVLSSAGVFINNYIPQSAEMIRILAGDKAIPSYTITVLPGGTEVLFRGGLRAGSARELEKILSAVPQAKVLHIESIGGRILEAKAMGKLVHARQMTTYTSERCLSAATLVLMSGKERVIATDAKVGFHSGNFPGFTSDQMREMNDALRSTMQAAGVSISFINRVLSTPNDEMWYPTFEEMRTAGVITGQSAGERFASSWGLSDRDWEAALEAISKYPCYRTIKQVEPETFSMMMSNFIDAIRSGKSEGEAIAEISEVAGNIMDKYIPAASDEALLALLEQWISILTKYKDKNSQACIAVFTQAKINYQRVFPDWNMTDSLLVMEKVISSGANKVPVPIDMEVADSDLSMVLQPLLIEYGDDFQLFADESEWPANSQKVCDMLLLYFQEIAKMEDKRSANLVRYLITSE